MLFWGLVAALGAAVSGPVLTTGNLSVDYISHSPIGCAPNLTYVPEIPSVESLQQLKAQGLWGYEDYIAWGAVEREEGIWDWSHHLEVKRRVEAAGLVYIPYIWCHYPPVWLRKDPRITLMRSTRAEECYMLSIYDSRTLEWYRRFYVALRKAMPDLREVYACLLGPYAEGNYPLPNANFVVDVGNCPDGRYWCGDRYALPAFQRAIKKTYGNIAKLNEAWGTSYARFDEIQFPEVLREDHIPGYAQRDTHERRRWLDFVRWYHAALVEFSRGSIGIVSDLFGKARTSAKPGGNSGWMNPVSWGTHNPSFAKMGARMGVTLQSADSHGAYWADKWTSTAYAYYGVPYRTEAAGSLDESLFQLRTFTDISCGASRLFSYELNKHMSTATRYLPLFTGERGQVSAAILAPTTLHYLNENVMPAIEKGSTLRDLFDYDVLDEQLIRDGALRKYPVLIAIDTHVVEAATASRLMAWVRKGGALIWVSAQAAETVDGQSLEWINSATTQGTTVGKGNVYRFLTLDSATEECCMQELRQRGALCDGVRDGVWVTRRKQEVLAINTTKAPVSVTLSSDETPHEVTLNPFETQVFPIAR